MVKPLQHKPKRAGVAGKGVAQEAEFRPRFTGIGRTRFSALKVFAGRGRWLRMGVSADLVRDPQGDTEGVNFAVTTGVSGNRDDPPGEAGKHRRAETRQRVSGTPWLRRARLKDGPDILILDISSSGILFRCDEELDRNTTVVLELTGPQETTLVPALVVRSHRLTSRSFNWYEIGCRLKRPHALDDLLRAQSNSGPAAPKKKSD